MSSRVLLLARARGFAALSRAVFAFYPRGRANEGELTRVVTPSGTSFDEKLLFALEHEIERSDQLDIIREVRRDGLPVRGQHSSPHTAPFWNWMGLSEPDPRGIPK